MSDQSSPQDTVPSNIADPAARLAPKPPASRVKSAGGKETGGPSGLEPTRYGDWEHKGRCIDF
ncbi:MAG: DUF1674 domain-containing protein [Alphaproteobacteria bacterium]|nr:DUF1674 domain-containing protein [Alphaproteobacteria bacterium]